MHLHQLWVFYHVARHGSFSRAANALFLSQPSVSNQVKRLEEVYGIRLFERAGKTRLTRAGEVLFTYAERIFTLAREAESAIEALKRTRGGKITISAGNTLGAYYLPDIIARFRQRHPRTEIRMTAGYTQSVVEDVLASRSDLGLIGQSVDHPNLVQLPLWEEELVLVVPPGHPFARRRSVPVSRLQDESLILSERGSGVRTVTDGLFARAGVSPRIAMELGENEAVKRAVASGQGITVISAKAVKEELEAGTLRAVRLSGSRLRRRFFLIHHRDRPLSRLIRAFLEEVLRDETREVGPRPLPSTLQPPIRKGRKGKTRP
ncbi:MAG: LysR family transcriptional regulator [Deltaproteobacteria bacterium]|nr:LysR family transcriptional regulator [Deltaproteobacteria bacterium]